MIKWITVDSLISRTCIEHQWRGSRTVWRDNHSLETSTWSLSSRARALTCYCILCKGRERGLIDHLLTKRWIGIETSTVFFVYYEQCFRSWHASRGKRYPQWSTLLSDFLHAQVYKQPCKKHKSRSYQRERCDLPFSAVYRTIQRFTLMDNKSTCAQSD